MVEDGSPTVRRRRLAAELRQLREAKGRSGESVAHALRWSPSKISRYERAKTGLRPKEVERLLDYYGVGGAHREMLLALAQDASQKGWWKSTPRASPRTTSSSSALSTRRPGTQSGTWTWSRACCRPRATPGTSSTATTG